MTQPEPSPDAPPESAEAPLALWRRLHRWGVANPKWYYITPPSAWAVTIYVASLAPVDKLDPLRKVMFPGADKIIHALLYAVLALLIVRGWQREKMPPLGLHGFVFLLSLAFGLTIEIHQGVVPYRSFEWLDLVADGAGALMGLSLWHLLMMRWGKRTRLYPGLLRPDYKDHASVAKRKRT